MKLTSKQLRKFVKEEIQKVYEIGVSGRSAWDPTNVKKREKEVRRLGKDKIAQLRRDAEEDQKDRAKSPRFKKPVNEEDEEDGHVFAGFGAEISPGDLSAARADYEKYGADDMGRLFGRVDKNWEYVLAMLPDEVDKETFFRKVQEAVLNDDSFQYWDPRDSTPRGEYFEKMRDMNIPGWQQGHGYWAPPADQERKRVFHIWWLNIASEFTFGVLETSQNIIDYARRWQAGEEAKAEEAEKVELDKKEFVFDSDFMKGWFKEGKMRMRITTKQLTRIIKEEVQSILKEEGRTPTIPEFIMSLTGAEGYKSSVDLEKQGRGEKDWLKFGIEDVMGQFYVPLSSADKKIADNIFYELIQQEESSENIATRTYVALLEYGLDINSMRFETIWLVLREILEFVETSSIGDAE